MTLPKSAYTSDWAHSPPHWLEKKGSYFITTGTYTKVHIFKTKEALDFLQSTMMSLICEFQFKPHAWAIFSNHYHLIIETDQPKSISRFIKRLHGSTAFHINKEQNQRGRKVWNQYWDRKIDERDEWYACLNYVMKNPLKHGLVSNPCNYPWCSAGLFSVTAPDQLIRTVEQFNYTLMEIDDEY